MKEFGCEYNPETARLLIEKKFSFEACGFAFRYSLDIPHYILQRFNSEILGKLQEYMSGYCLKVVTAALQGGYVHTPEGEARMREDVGKHLKNYIWERFSITQQEAGNACWQTAPSLQEVHTQ